MKNRLKTILAFSILIVVVISAVSLSALDRARERYPDANTRICLYGEKHGIKTYYDIELDLWKEHYTKGDRALFVELPYYTAEFLNLWMKEDSDEIIDQIFEDIQGTQGDNQNYNDFFHEIKKQCPQTVFYGTDVGHQYDTTGARYLKYLEDHGLENSEDYHLARECVEQGIKYHTEDYSPNGFSSIREAYMVANFIDAYERCGADQIMGIYGSYHTDLTNPDLMTGQLKSHYGDIISSVRLSTLMFGENIPYRFGFCFTGFLFLVMLFAPNIYWGKKAKPKGYEEVVGNENKLLLLLERIGEVLVSCSLLIFPALDPYIKATPDGIIFDWKLLLWIAALILMILYECYWIRYFRSDRTLRDQYSSFAGFPVAGATLPVLAVLLLGVYAMNLIVLISGIILGIGHIGIHVMHGMEVK